MKLQIAILCCVLTIGAMGGFAAGLIVGQPSVSDAVNILSVDLQTRGGDCSRYTATESFRHPGWAISIDASFDEPHASGLTSVGGVGETCPDAYWDAVIAELDAKQAEADAQARQDRRNR